MDYNFLKQLIMIHTTTPEHEGGVGITIPGCMDEHAQKFERQFYEELCKSYNNVSLFAFSKAGELDRRLSVFLFLTSLWCFSAVQELLGLPPHHLKEISLLSATNLVVCFSLFRITIAPHQ